MTFKTAKDLCFRIADIPLRLVFEQKDASLLQSTLDRLACFLDPEMDCSPFPIYVNHMQLDDRLRPFTIGDARLYFGPEYARLENVRQYLDVEFLLRAILTLILAEKRGILLHASSVMQDGEAYVFVGRSGAGKSTMAELSLPRLVMSDEGSVVRFVAGAFRCYCTPFWGSWGRGRLESHKGSAPLAAIYALAKAKENRIERLRGSEALKVLMSCHMFLDQDRTLVPRCLENAELLALRAPIYRLHFRPEGEVWDTILENRSGNPR